MIVFQCKESLQRGMSSLILLTFICFKRGLLGLLIYWKAQTGIWPAALLSDIYGTWEMRGHDSICVLDLFLFFWKMMDTAGHGWDMACATKKKKKSVTHYLSHQSPPTSSHTDLLCRQSSSHPDLFFFSFSSIYFSFAVPPFALILVLFVSFFSLFFFIIFFFSYFTLSHM